MDRAKIDSVLGFLLKKNGLKNYQELASTLGIGSSTLSTHIKNLSSEDYDSEQFIKRLSKVFDVKEDELIKLFEEGISGQDAHLKLIDHLTSTYQDLEKGYQNEILELTSKLGNGDIYTFCTTFQPIEIYDYELKNEIIKALDRGAKFRYIYPGKEIYAVIERYKTRENSAYKNLVSEHQKFIDDLKRKEDLNNELVARIEYTECNDPILVHPMFKFIHLKRVTMGVTDITVFSEAKIGNYKSQSQLAYWYPLPKIDSQNVDKQIKKLFKN